MCLASTGRNQKKASYTLEVELQAIVADPCEIKILLQKTSHALDTGLNGINTSETNL